MKLLLVPGLWNSGPEHWQSYWERDRPGCVRVEQSDWATPRRDDWVTALEAAVAAAAAPVVIAAHSLGCTLVAHWGPASAHAAQVRGALLVAPSDCEAASYPGGTTGFAPMPRKRLPFPSVIVSSSDDVHVSPARASEFASWWGSRVIDVGAKGHVNSASGLGAWPEGWALVEALTAAT